MNGPFQKNPNSAGRRFSDIRPRRPRGSGVSENRNFSRVSPPAFPVQRSSADAVQSEARELSPQFQFRKPPTSLRGHSSGFFWRVKNRVASDWFSFASRISILSEIFDGRRFVFSGAAIGLLLLLFWCLFSLIGNGIALKKQVLGSSMDGYQSLSRAVDEAKQRDFAASAASLVSASSSFSDAMKRFEEWNETLIEYTKYVPGLSKLSSGKHVILAAKGISDAGVILLRVGSRLESVGNPLDSANRVSLLETLRSVRGDLSSAEELLSGADRDLHLVSAADLPTDKREEFVRLSEKVSDMAGGIRLFLDHENILSDMLGENGPRKFLFLFQNNQEARATGGFIGSYAFLDIANGRTRKFFIDGIFNPDGQLKEDIVPPKPIQKVSSAWSLHDSNWFPDFPVSAEKAILFYEKTGGPTVDGVIACTPDMIQRFLEISGPIRLDRYGVTVHAENFLETVQYQVEVAYDKVENRPKQILSDLAPILIDRVLGSGSSARSISLALAAVESEFAKKHILLYSRNPSFQSLISRAGWSGEVLSARKDYLSVINSNINGFKTDGVIDETIKHRADIKDDGSVVDTVTVRRVHRGGKTGYDWWDRVNADYLRVYVPLGSKLLSASGYTPETVNAPLDYDALHFLRDPDIEREERGTVLDPASGTRISEDAGKTVFGNWVYVSPGETVELTYTYLLPFQVDPHADESGMDEYSLVAQKQAGSKGSAFSFSIHFPEDLTPVWQTGDRLTSSSGNFQAETDLTYDRFFGILLSLVR